MQRTFSDPYAREVIAPDGRNFAELASNMAVLTRETLLARPADSGAGTKILHFLYPAEDTSPEDAQHVWSAAHEAALETAPELAKALTGLARSDALPAADSGPGGHFGGSEKVAAALVISLWVPDSATPAFRAYEQSVIANPAFDARYSHFLFAREKLIYDRAEKREPDIAPQGQRD